MVMEVVMGWERGIGRRGGWRRLFVLFVVAED